MKCQICGKHDATFKVTHEIPLTYDPDPLTTAMATTYACQRCTLEGMSVNEAVGDVLGKDLVYTYQLDTQLRYRPDPILVGDTSKAYN